MTKITHDKPKTVTTDEGNKIERKPGITDATNSPDPALSVKARILSEEELETLAGDLGPGENGFLPLDKDGRPSGPATREPPASGDYASVTVPIPSPPKELMTPSGAPVTHMMNPDANVEEKRDRADQVETGLSKGAEHDVE